MRALLLRACLLCSALLFGSATTRAQQPRWDGLDRLISVARDTDTELIVGDSLDLGRLHARDALLIVGPEASLPTSALTTFLREGGRVALLDDFGSGERLLSAYQVTRSRAPDAKVPALRKDPGLLLAYPASEHPLVDGVDLLLTNGAMALHHRDLKPVFTFGRSDQALVLAGAVGAGRLVAAGDASLLINQLMELPAHQQFARNLLGYLKRPAGRVFLVDSRTRFAGVYGPEDGRGLSRVDTFLKRVAHPDLPASVLSLLGLGLCAIAAVVVLGLLPRRSPYVRAELLPRASVYAGFAARVAVSDRNSPNQIWTLLDYRRELTSELSRRFKLSLPLDAEQLQKRALERGATSDLASELFLLLNKLDEVALRADGHDRPPRIRVSELRNVVRQGEELLTRLGNE
jgi:hypothetical protein